MERGSINMNDMNTLLPHIKLHFNIEHPNFEECYAYGYECAMAEVGEEKNPYRVGTKESEHWLEGWWAGLYGDMPLYELSDGSNDSASLMSASDAANDQSYHNGLGSFLFQFFEVTGVLIVSAAVGYQVLDLLVA